MTVSQQLNRLLLPVFLGLLALVALSWYGMMSNHLQRDLEERLQAIAVSVAALLDQKLVPQKLDLPEDYAHVDVFLLQKVNAARFALKPLTHREAQADVPVPTVSLTHAKKAFFQKEEGRMAAYAPLVNGSWVVVETNTTELIADRKALIGMIVMATTLIGLVIVMVVRIAAQRIREPLEKLKSAVLVSAGGGQTSDMPIAGAQEIADLANAFNTMRACLHENMSHIRESSIRREMTYGEHECCLLLQHYMLDKILDKFRSSLCEIREVSIRSAALPMGFWIDLSETKQDVAIRMAESHQPGLGGILDLLTHAKAALEDPDSTLSYVGLKINHQPLQAVVTNRHMPAPFIWSTHLEAPVQPIDGVCAVEEGDYIILFNQAVSKLIKKREIGDEWLKKVLRHFAQDGLDGIIPMLRSELDFVVKALHLDADFYLLCCRVQKTL